MIRIRNIKVDVKTNNLREMISKKIKTDNFTIQKILHKSIDARNKSNVFYVYDVLVNTNEKIRFNEDILEPNFTNNEIKVTRHPYGEEKKRSLLNMGIKQIDEFYYDSKSDEAVLSLAVEGYKVNRGIIV